MLSRAKVFSHKFIVEILVGSAGVDMIKYYRWSLSLISQQVGENHDGNKYVN
jgi:hypothetical protein